MRSAPPWLLNFVMKTAELLIYRVNKTEGDVMANEPDFKSEHESDSADLERRIRERAYQLWDLEGRQEGRAEEYWNRAAEQIESDTRSAYPPSASRGHRT
jgi:hypothetical protein